MAYKKKDIGYYQSKLEKAMSEFFSTKNKNIARIKLRNIKKSLRYKYNDANPKDRYKIIKHIQGINYFEKGMKLLEKKGRKK